MFHHSGSDESYAFSKEKAKPIDDPLKQIIQIQFDEFPGEPLNNFNSLLHYEYSL
jgi:hypothetical protein